MAFFDWLGGQISSAGDWLFSGDHVLNAASTAANLLSGSDSKKKSSDISGGILGRALAEATSARAKEGDKNFRSTPTAGAGRPAPVAGTSGPIFKGAGNDDPWMASMRNLLSLNKVTNPNSSVT